MARVVEVLSLSTIPQGSSSGCPSFIKDVKKKMTTSGNTTADVDGVVNHQLHLPGRDVDDSSYVER